MTAWLAGNADGGQMHRPAVRVALTFFLGALLGPVIASAQPSLVPPASTVFPNDLNVSPDVTSAVDGALVVAKANDCSVTPCRTWIVGRFVSTSTGSTLGDPFAVSDPMTDTVDDSLVVVRGRVFPGFPTTYLVAWATQATDSAPAHVEYRVLQRSSENVPLFLTDVRSVPSPSPAPLMVRSVTAIYPDPGLQGAPDVFVLGWVDVSLDTVTPTDTVWQYQIAGTAVAPTGDLCDSLTCGSVAMGLVPHSDAVAVSTQDPRPVIALGYQPFNVMTDQFEPHVWTASSGFGNGIVVDGLLVALETPRAGALDFSFDGLRLLVTWGTADGLVNGKFVWMSSGGFRPRVGPSSQWPPRSTGTFELSK